MDSATAKAALVEKVSKREPPEETIHRAMEEKLDANYLVKSMTRMHNLYSEASFNDEAKFGLPRNILMKISEIPSFRIYRGKNGLQYT